MKVLSSETDGPATVRSPLQLLNIVKPLGSKTDGPATVRSPLQLFNIVKLPGSKTDGPATAILHCGGFQRYTVQRPTALLLYVVKALVCGILFADGPAAAAAVPHRKRFHRSALRINSGHAVAAAILYCGRCLRLAVATAVAVHL